MISDKTEMQPFFMSLIWHLKASRHDMSNVSHVVYSNPRLPVLFVDVSKEQFTSSNKRRRWFCFCFFVFFTHVRSGSSWDIVRTTRICVLCLDLFFGGSKCNEKEVKSLCNLSFIIKETLDSCWTWSIFEQLAVTTREAQLISVAVLRNVKW